VDPANPKFRTFAKADGLSAVQPLKIGTVSGGFRSDNTDFFNYSTRLTVPAGDVGNALV
jgi:hypothetical protein